VANRKTPHYDQKLESILRQSAAVFCARGYHQASMRDISRATGVSLAGLYYYFSSKEHLLFLIQRHTFETILASSRRGIEDGLSPESRLRAFVRLHLQYFLQHPNEMKVINHEAESLEDERRREVRALKKAYYRLCFDQVEALKQAQKLAGFNTRIAVLSLFGMMNWIYTWYNPKVDPDAGRIASQMIELFLKGMTGFSAEGREVQKTSRPLFLARMTSNGQKHPARVPENRAANGRARA